MKSINSTKRFDCSYDAKDIFNVNFPLAIPGFKENSASVPPIDINYHFDKDVTRIILAALVHNKRLLIHGLHGTGKSTHIEQVCARLNIPCIRINLDSQISRADLVGRDAITIKDGIQVTEFKEGIIPYGLRHPCVLVFDEYDAGRPEVMFVIQRMLEDNGQFALLEKGEVIKPHPDFRIFATANTVGFGDNTGVYHGTRVLNQGQMDRWSLTVRMSFMPPEIEANIILAKVPSLNNPEKALIVKAMINLATMIRTSFIADEISSLLSPRATLSWAENIAIFDDVELAFKLSFLNRADPFDYEKISEFYQRCFDAELITDKVFKPNYSYVA